MSLETALSKNDWSQIPEKKLKKVYVFWGILSKFLIINTSIICAFLKLMECHYSCKVLWEFQQEEKRLPTTSEDDIRKLKSLRDSLLTSNSVKVSIVTDEFLE